MLLKEVVTVSARRTILMVRALKMKAANALIRQVIIGKDLLQKLRDYGAKKTTHGVSALSKSGRRGISQQIWALPS